MKKMNLQYYFIVILTVSLSACYVIQPVINVNRIKAKFCTPIQIINNKTIGDTISVFFSTYKNYRIIELPYHVTLENATQLIYDSVKYEYLIEDINKKYGYLVKNYKDIFLKINNKDSILERAFKGLDGNFFDFELLKLYDKRIIKRSKNKFILKYLTHDKFYDSIYLYFDKDLINYNFSISNKLDSINNSKFYKLELFIKNDSLKKLYPMFKEFFINSLEVSTNENDNDKEQNLRNLFERFILFEKNSL